MYDKEKQNSTADQAAKILSAQRTAWLKNDTTIQGDQNFHPYYCDPVHDDKHIHLSQTKSHTGQLYRQATSHYPYTKNLLDRFSSGGFPPSNGFHRKQLLFHNDIIASNDKFSFLP